MWSPFFLVFSLAVVSNTFVASENQGKVYSCQIKEEQCQFYTNGRNGYTYSSCKNDDTRRDDIRRSLTVILDEGYDLFGGDSPDPEEMMFCTAKMAEISDLTDAQKPWVLCSEDCFVGCKLH